MNLPIIIGSILGLAIIGFDIYFAADSVPNNEFSAIIRTWGKATTFVPWVCGVLSGHFFHPVDGLQPILQFPGNIALLVWLTGAVTLFGVIMSKMGYAVPLWSIFIPACIVGSLLWPVGAHSV